MSDNLHASTWEIVAAVFALAMIASGIAVVYRMRRKPKDKEQRRRLSVNLHGRLGDATITEVHDHTIFYSYSVRGVAYTASQDISQLQEHVPAALEKLIGPVSLKYAPANPANSIVVCEEWSGLRSKPSGEPPWGAEVR